MRYEVRVYNLEEWLPENRMTYSPFSSYDEAKARYAEMLQSYADEWHEVELCEVEYTPWGESVNVLASTRNDDPRHIIIKEDWVESPEGE